MKRSTYGPAGAGRGRPALPKPKAPLPFNLPSMKREAGIDGASGGIASAGAKWASPRASGSTPAEPAGQPSSAAAGSPTAPAPAQPAWGGAGVRAVQKKKEFPTLRENPDPPPQNTSNRPAFEIDNSDWAEDDDADINFSAPLALPEVSIPPAPSPPPPVQQPPPQLQQQFGHERYGARDLQRPRGRHQPPAAHWAAAIKGQQEDVERQRHQNVRALAHHTARPVSRTIDMPDLKVVEEQKNLMKAKAESAQEARRRAEEERLRAQRERSNQKLRELEERMGLANKTTPHQETKASAAPPSSTVESIVKGASSPKVLARPAQTVQSAWKSGPPVKLGADSTSSPAAGSSSSTSRIDNTPKVVLRRPAKEPEDKPAVEQDAGEVLASLRRGKSDAPHDSREGAKPRRRNGNRGEQNGNDHSHRSNAHRDRDGGSQYDGPLENETRDQWLQRRRNQTEARDAVQSIINTCINRAVYGRRNSGRRGQGRRQDRGGRGRRDRDGGQRSDSKAGAAQTQDTLPQASALSKPTPPAPHDTQEGPPKLDLPSPLQPGNEALSVPASRQPPPRKPSQPSAWALRVTQQSPTDLQQRLPRRPQNSRGQRQDQQNSPPHLRTTDSVLLSPSAQAARGARHSGSLTQQPRDRVAVPPNASRPVALQPARPAPWAPKVPKVSLAPPLSSPGTATVTSVVDAVVGTDTSPTTAPKTPVHQPQANTQANTQKSGGRGSASGEERDTSRPKKSKRGGQKERQKRERRENIAAERSAAKSAAAVAQSSSATAVGVETKSQAQAYNVDSRPPAGRGSGPAHISPDESSAAWSASSRAVPPTSFDEISRAFSNTPSGFPLVGAPFVPLPNTSPALAANRSTWSTSAAWPDSSNSASKWWSTQSAQSATSSQRAPVASANSNIAPGTVGSTAISRQPREEAGPVPSPAASPAAGAQKDGTNIGEDSRSKRSRGRRGNSSSGRRRKQTEGPNVAQDSASRPKTAVKGPTSSLSLNASTPSDLVGNTAATSTSITGDTVVTPATQANSRTVSQANPASNTPTAAARDRDTPRSRSGRGGGRGGRRGRHRPREGSGDASTSRLNGAPSSTVSASANGAVESGANNVPSAAGASTSSNPATKDDNKALGRNGSGGPRRGRGSRGRRGHRGGHRQGNGRESQKTGGGATAGSNSNSTPVSG